ncbi:MAG: ParA family protein [Gammaproteobacteria bacterium]|nr:ParA family protein [Gammaproteobacteria bacterium]
MPVIALVGNKGGAGKTTLCVNLAGGLAERAPTIILDADPQRSSLQWRELADESTPLAVVDAVDDVREAIGTAIADHEFVVVDCPPSVQSPQTLQVLECCDVALIPVQPSPLDLWATVHNEDRVESARQVNPEMRAVLVINQLEPRTKLSKLMRTALAELSLPVADTAIRRRIAYRNAILEGRTVLDIGSRGAEAAAEIRALITEVFKA